MNTKMFLLLIFGMLLCTSLTRTAFGTAYIKGWLGNGLELDHAVISPELSQISTSGNISIDLIFWNYGDLYVNSIQMEVDEGLYNAMNVTLAKDFNWSLNSHNPPGTPLERTVVFTPNKAGIGSLSIYISADYEYTEGNLTFEQKGSIDLLSIIPVPTDSYADFWNQYVSLQADSAKLNTTYQTLNTSYQDLQKLTLFLGATTALFITATAFVVSRRHKSKERMQPSHPISS